MHSQVQTKNTEILPQIQGKKNPVLIVEPKAAFSKGEVVNLGRRIDAFINEHDEVPSLVIHATHFSGWKDLGALTQHIRLIRAHHSLIPKIAIVGDGATSSILPKLLNHFVAHFVAAKLQHFSEHRLDEAKSWAADPAKDIGSVDWIMDLPDDVLAFQATGPLTAKMYEHAIMPAIEKRLTVHDRLKLLVHLGPKFDGYTAGAAWDDARVGLMHFSGFSRCAIVTDVDGYRAATKIFGPLLKGPVHLFANDELATAKEWIRA